MSQLSVFSTKKVQHITELLAAVTMKIAGSEEQNLQNLLYDQETLLKEIYIAKDYYQEMDTQSADLLLEFEKDQTMSNPVSVSLGTE